MAQVDYMELAKLMYKNKNIYKAQQNLSKVKVEEVDPEEYYRLQGLIELKLQRFMEATYAFKQVEAVSGFEKDVYLFYAQAEFGLGKYEQAQKMLEKGKGHIEHYPKYYLLNTMIHQKVKNYDKAWSFIHQGMTKFPKNTTLKKQKWLMLVELKLYQQSFVWLSENKEYWKQLEYLQFAGEYRNRKQFRQALATGEMGRLLFPKDDEISMELARVYLQQNKIFAAASLMDQVATRNIEFADKASEVWRQAGNNFRSLYWASFIQDKNDLLKQKLTLAISEQDFEKVMHLTPMIERSELFQSEDIQYALAYAHLMNGYFSKVGFYLKDIARSDLLKKSLVLRDTLANCQQRPDQCL